MTCPSGGRAARPGTVSATGVEAASIDLARRQDQAGDIDFTCGDFPSHPVKPASFGTITPAAAPERTSQHLRPGGTPAIT